MHKTKAFFIEKLFISLKFGTSINNVDKHGSGEEGVTQFLIRLYLHSDKIISQPNRFPEGLSAV